MSLTNGPEKKKTENKATENGNWWIPTETQDAFTSSFDEFRNRKAQGQNHVDRKKRFQNPKYKK